MKKITFLLCAVAAIALSISCSNPRQSVEDYTRFVDPFIGTGGNGHTFPGACCPFGMVQTSPVTGAIDWAYCAEYVYSDTLIWGFSQTHLNGTGCADLGDILVTPVTGERLRPWDAYRNHYDKASEAATPGYYTVELADANVRAELTATPHVALHRYTYHTADSASVLIDFQNAPSWDEEAYHSHVQLCDVEWRDSQTLVGHVRTSLWVDKDCFFFMQFNHPVVDTLYLPLADKEVGKRIVATFTLEPEEELLMKVALSTTSIEGAQKNLEAELAGWDFNATRDAAHDEWNNYLSRIEVTGSDEEKTNFYTSFYHALIQPNEISDVDGMYRNGADSIVKAEGEKFYSTFSLWDTYRAAHPFYTIIIPERVDGFVNSLIEQAEVQGFIPIWTVWGKENYCMVANHGVPVVAEAYRKGFRGFDAERAFAAVKNTQTVPHKMKSDWDTYMKYGYLPTDLIANESVSSTLESVYDDYAAADMARRMGKEEDAEYFAKRADFYKNLFDEQTQFMRPRNADGTWKTPFNPFALTDSEEGRDYTEGNAWQYTWHVQHDVPGLIELFGGEEAFTTKLDSLFILELESTVSDVTGLIGQYAHGNEPSHHVVYLYTIAGKPERTQELVREIFDTQYHPSPDGLCGNDDCGQMSAWYMFSAMGFYPVDPVSGNYVFGAPQMPKFVLHLAGGKTFTIIAKGLSQENKYIDHITLNGEPYTLNYISHEDIMKGGELVYYMK